MDCYAVGPTLGAGVAALMAGDTIIYPYCYRTQETVSYTHLEIITWKQLGLYLNPIIILNTNRFFDPLLEMLEKAIDESFMRRQRCV